MDNPIQNALNNVINGHASSDEIELVRQALVDGQISIGGNLANSVIVLGNGNAIQLSPEALDLLTARRKPSFSPLNVFLCYASNDTFAVRKLSKYLERNARINVWLAEENIVPGQDWQLEITKAIRDADVIIVCLSSHSISKKDFIQGEIPRTLDLAMAIPERQTYVIPARLDECGVPRSLRSYQGVDLFNNRDFINFGESLERLLDFPRSDKHLERAIELAADPTEVTIVVEKDFLQFNDTEKDRFVSAISKLTGVPWNEIRVLKITKGSVIIILELPEFGAKRLMELYYQNNSEIEKLGISKITVNLEAKENRAILPDDGPLTILFLTADPTDACRLRLGQEAREIQEKLQMSKHRERFSFSQRWSVRPADISQAMLDLQPHIVHFSGHGAQNGAICFENLIGKMQPISPDALSSLFEQFSDQVRVVVLNACYSDQQAQAISKQVDYVIGMNTSITDPASIAFSIGFYQAIGAGRNIVDAHKLGVTQIKLQGIEEHEIPVLVQKNF